MSGSNSKKVKTPDIWEKCLQGIIDRFQKFYPDRTTPTVIVAARNDLRALVKNNKTPAFPFFALQPASIQISESSYNPFLLKHRGKRGPKINIEPGPRNIAGTQLVYKFVPTTAQITVRFISQDSKDIIRFSSAWFAHAVEHTLNYDIEVGGTEVINIKTELERSLSYPDLELEEVGPMTVIETMITIHGYTGNIEKVRTVDSVAYKASIVTPENINDPNSKATFEEIVLAISNFQRTDDSVV